MQSIFCPPDHSVLSSYLALIQDNEDHLLFPKDFFLSSLSFEHIQVGVAYHYGHLWSLIVVIVFVLERLIHSYLRGVFSLLIFF